MCYLSDVTSYFSFRSLESKPLSELEEAFILIHALRDANMPKFLAEDVPLFENILADLFPGIDPPQPDYGVLEVTKVVFLTLLLYTALFSLLSKNFLILLLLLMNALFTKVILVTKIPLVDPNAESNLDGDT